MTKIQKISLTVAILSITAGLVGCGGGSPDVYDGGTGNNSQTILNFSQFHIEEDKNEQNVTVGVGRQDYSIGNGNYRVTEKTLWGKLSPSTTVHYTVASNFFNKRVGDDLSTVFKNSRITQPSDGVYVWESDTLGENNQILHETMSFKTIDISGKFNFAEKQKQGLRLDMLLDYAKLPAEVTFPTGSVCYAEYQDTMSKPTFYFSQADVTSFTSLEDSWHTITLPQRMLV